MNDLTTKPAPTLPVRALSPEDRTVPERSRRLMELALERVVIFDGSMGSQILDSGLPPAEWGVPDCPESLNKSHPQMIQQIHRSYLEAGADVVETNTFNANLALREFSIEDQVLDLNLRSARNAREVCDSFTARDGRPRFVSGSMGPGTKLASINPPNTTFEELDHFFGLQVTGLLRGGADVLQIETQQDLLCVKAAVYAARRVFEHEGKRLPIIVQVSMENGMGTMLVGSDALSAYTMVEPFEEVWAVGLNCGTGPDPMADHLRTLCDVSSRHVSCLPNAGIPYLDKNGRTVYPLLPADFAAKVHDFVKDFGVGLAGGCCGTTPKHIAALSKIVAAQPPKKRVIKVEPSVASLLGSVTLDQEPKPLFVGERLNATGSKKFKEALGREDWDLMLAMAKEQEKEQAHVLDVMLAYVGRDEVKDAATFLPKLRGFTKLPICIDTTEYAVVEEALKRLPGRAILNSINLEDGEANLIKKVQLAKRYGAACVALTIDEKGQATTTDWKVECAHRIHDIACAHGLRPQDLIFDALTFPIVTGQEETRRAGIETLDAIRRIKRELPGVRTILGLPTVSFGIDPEARVALNSVFLSYAVEAGLDAAIVHVSKIMPLARIDPEVREVCRRLVFNEREKSDPLQDLLALFSKREKKKVGPQVSNLPVEKRLEQRIVDGARSGLEADLDAAVAQGIAPLDVINKHLLEGMRVVGELFGKGEMQLPFVLQSAEVMKAAVKHLEAKMEKKAGTTLGTCVLATVKGDVHDIGKNLVDIILTNNGFSVANLGIKIGLDDMLKAATEKNALAIGMSGLLVKSTVIMRENLEELNRRNLTPDIILGGAALNRRYVEEDLRGVYKGRVFYAKDAFEGLRLMDALARGRDPEEVSRASRDKEHKPAETAAAGGASEGSANGTAKQGAASDGADETEIVVAEVKPIVPALPPAPPFWGGRHDTAPATVDETLSWINPLAVIRGQWRIRRGNKTRDEQKKIEQEIAYPLFEKAKASALEQKTLAPAWTYGYFPARRQGDSVVVLEAPGSSRERLRFDFPRARAQRGGRSIADFFREDREDVLALMLVTVGSPVSARIRELKDAGQYTDMLYLQGIAAEATEGLAEMLHARIRRELGIADKDGKTRDSLFRMVYRGARYSFGYPACPELDEQRKIAALLPVQELGVSLTESAMLEPEFSTAAVVCHHPQARYFSL